MIYFNIETREFSTNKPNVLRRGLAQVKGASANKWGLATGLGNIALNKIKREQLTRDYESQGKDPATARRLAKKQTSGLVGSFIKGHMTGVGAKIAANSLGLTKLNDVDRKILGRPKPQTAYQQKSAKIRKIKNKAERNQAYYDNGLTSSTARRSTHFSNNN